MTRAAMKLVFIFLYLTVCKCIPTPIGGPEEGDFFEGDMVLTPDQMKAIQGGTTVFGAGMKKRLWLVNGKAETIKYYIDPELAKESKAVNGVKMAVEDYHKNTCIRFQRVNEKPSGPHFYFYKGKGCHSHLGKTKQNRISIGKGCWGKGTVSHEMGHSLGLYHEQSRPDRDQYVKILWENIKDGRQGNFKKHGYDRIDTRGGAYDFESMMHYGGRAFSKSRKLLTIQTVDPANQRRIGQRKGMSPGDIANLRKMYFC